MSSYNSQKIICYYICNRTLEEFMGAHSLNTSNSRSLFDDIDLTNIIGYTTWSGTLIPWDNKDLLYNSEALFFIDNKIFKCNYIKKYNETISTLISYLNLGRSQQPLGSITREILEDGLTRKVTIEYKE